GAADDDGPGRRSGRRARRRARPRGDGGSSPEEHDARDDGPVGRHAPSSLSRQRPHGRRVPARRAVDRRRGPRRRLLWLLLLGGDGPRGGEAARALRTGVRRLGRARAALLALGPCAWCDRRRLLLASLLAERRVPGGARVRRRSRAPLVEDEARVTPLRVLHVDPERGWGGGEVQVLGLVRELAARGHRSTLAVDPAGALAGAGAAAGIPAVPLPIANHLDLRAG